jgi:small subunit ribosomal protein S3
MAIEKIFVKEGIKEADIEEYLEKKFEKAGYSHSKIERTPLGTRIIIYAHKPGLVIGRSGRKIDEIAEEIRKKFGFENPFLDPHIIAKRIARALEKGINYKKVCNYYVERVMEAGAIGVLIRVSGKLIGKERSHSQKFKAGFIAHSGDYAERLVKVGRAQAMLKVGIVGVEVRIMEEAPQELEFEKGIRR